MKIRTFEAIPVSIPLGLPLGGSYYAGAERLEYVLVRLGSDEGITGLWSPPSAASPDR